MISTLYWLVVLTHLGTALTSFIVIGSILLVILICYLLVEDHIDNALGVTFAKRIIKWVFPLTCLCILLEVFIPSKTELAAIYGIGTAVEYIQNNEEARQLPDSLIKELGEWIKKDE